MKQETNEDHKPWKTQRQLKKEDIPPPPTIITMAQTLQKPQEQALFIMAYLTAGRISEIVQTKNLIKNHYQRNAKGKVQKNKNGSEIINHTTKQPLNYPGITKDNLSIITHNNRKILLISMQNRKNKKIKRKQIPIPIDKEKELTTILFKYINTLKPGQPLFPFTTWKARTILKKLKLNPHFIRDIRLTHMVIYHDFNEYFLTKFAGWKDSRPAEKYIRLKWTDMLQKY